MSGKEVIRRVFAHPDDEYESAPEAVPRRGRRGTRPLYAYHFCAADRRLGHGDGRSIAVGKTLRHEGGDLCLHHSGLHASVRIVDALQYAPAPILCRVQLSDRMIVAADSAVGAARRVLWMLDATTMLRIFARMQAAKVLHLWNAPKVAREYLRTGDDALRRAAEDARSAARTGVGTAAEAGAEATAWAATEAAAVNVATGAAEAAWTAAARAAWRAALVAQTATEAVAWTATRIAAETCAEADLLRLVRQARAGCLSPIIELPEAPHG